ncbi:hypothetical protein [uncultured Methanobrevibacter sp.]|uniref:hypothetical protein n=1 Tax=uncultured Methanobrevibacter sp. TaxID=253161 RepID=UPI0026098BC3|nr:hypothetical protein [uncultured Methanobrevibacter sp.]
MKFGKILIIFLVILITSVGVVSAGTFDLIEESSQSQSQSLDGIFEDIGGDGILKLNITSCNKLDERNIPDGSFTNLNGDNFTWKNAKNISFSDEMGFDSYVIVWKTSPDDYNLDTSSEGDQYISGYTPRYQDIYFLEYSKVKNAVYGVILGNRNQLYSQSDLVYGMLGFDESQLDVSSAVTGNLLSSGSSSSGSDSGSHYGGVDTSPYSLAKNDPGAYYDHYEYGDNYKIDDYLESQGFD